MKKKVWVVTYTSHYDEIYSETKVCSTEAKALQELADYVRDIHETANTNETLEDFAEEGFHGKHYFYYCDGLHEYLVEATETEIL
jgi:hypothetical protein